MGRAKGVLSDPFQTVMGLRRGNPLPRILSSNASVSEREYERLMSATTSELLGALDSAKRINKRSKQLDALIDEIALRLLGDTEGEAELLYDFSLLNLMNNVTSYKEGLIKECQKQVAKYLRETAADTPTLQIIDSKNAIIREESNKVIAQICFDNPLDIIQTIFSHDDRETLYARMHDSNPNTDPKKRLQSFSCAQWEYIFEHLFVIKDLRRDNLAEQLTFMIVIHERN